MSDEASHWDVHAKPKKARSRKNRTQKAYRDWFRTMQYKPYHITEPMDALNLRKDQVNQCQDKDRHLFRTWLSGQSNRVYRIGMALLEVQDFMIREEDYKLLLQNFERDWMTQPVYYDRYTSMYHVPGFAWKEKNDGKISNRLFMSFETKVFEAAFCGEKLNGDMPQLLDKTLEFRKFLLGYGEGQDEET